MLLRDIPKDLAGVFSPGMGRHNTQHVTIGHGLHTNCARTTIHGISLGVHHNKRCARLWCNLSVRAFKFVMLMARRHARWPRRRGDGPAALAR